jgi:hypothetical protein
MRTLFVLPLDERWLWAVSQNLLLWTFRGPDFGAILRDPGSNRDTEAPSSDTSGFPPKIHIAHIVDTMFDTVVRLELVHQFTDQDLQTAVGKFVLRHPGFSE